MKRAALISVSDKTGLVEFVKGLQSLGYTPLGTSGSKAFLEQAGVSCESIEAYTAQKEILGGRVKTLHPKIHAGLLAKRDDAEHMRQLEEDGIYAIDVAVINLYPFAQGLASDSATNPAKMIELIDVGGPTMIRASAKNFSGVLPVLDPADYDAVLHELAKAGSVGKTSLELRRKLSQKVFTFTANYDLTIAKYLSNVSFEGCEAIAQGAVDLETNLSLGPVTGAVLTLDQELRYGENPHQKARFYRSVDGNYKRNFEQLNGKELSYNNLLDFDAALGMAQSMPADSIGAVIIKHLNPCGAGFGTSVDDAIKKAKQCDPRSHFGGVIAVNRTLTAQAAEGIAGEFAEIVIAPDYEPQALQILSKNKNLRVLKCTMSTGPRFEMRTLQCGVLVQQSDTSRQSVQSMKVASARKPTPAELNDLEFAWTFCAHVKSNAITIAKGGMLVAVGAGQMSRIDSAELAVQKAKVHGHDLRGAVAASDAFFPFPDSVEFLAAAGIKAIVVPGGAKRDQEVIDVCNKLDVALLMSEERHFRH